MEGGWWWEKAWGFLSEFLMVFSESPHLEDRPHTGEFRLEKLCLCVFIYLRSSAECQQKSCSFRIDRAQRSLPVCLWVTRDSGPGPADCVVKPPGLRQGQDRRTGRSGMEATVALPCAACGCRRGPFSRHPGPALTCAPAVCSHYSYNSSLSPLSAPFLIKLSSKTCQIVLSFPGTFKNYLF